MSHPREREKTVELLGTNGPQTRVTPKVFMFTLESVTAILSAIAACSRRPMTATGIARKLELPDIKAAQVTEVLQVLEALPYISVTRTSANRISGFSIKYGAPGSCSRRYSSSALETYYYHENRLVDCTSERERAADIKARKAIQDYAQEHDLPLLSNLEWNVPNIAPYVLRALLTPAA